MVDCLIKNVTLVTPDAIEEESSIAIDNGLIVALGDYPSAQQTVDGGGLLAMAGIVDSHVHCREPGDFYKEDFKSFSKAALLGGITSVLDMPNSQPPVTSASLLNKKKAAARASFFCDYGFYVGASEANCHDLAQLEKMDGCGGIKLFMGSSTGDLLVEDDETIGIILVHGEGIVAFHAEDEARIRNRLKHRLNGEPRSHSVWRDEKAAALACRRLMALARQHVPTRPLHVLHVSTEDEVRAIRQGQQAGVNVTMEATPHHLILSEDDYDDLQGRAVVNPPLRARSHRDFLREAAQKGWIDTIGSDHAPHSLVEKDGTYPAIPSGVPTAGLLLPLMMQMHREGIFSLNRLTSLMAANPAMRYRLSGKGLLRVGYDADIVLVDAKQTRRIDGSDFAIKPFLGKSQWSPYEGRELTGWPRMTFLRGKKMTEDGGYCHEFACGAPLCFDVD